MGKVINWAEERRENELRDQAEQIAAWEEKHYCHALALRPHANRSRRRLNYTSIMLVISVLAGALIVLASVAHC